MILVDTSVWIDHFRKSDALLEGMLNRGRVLSHPFVIGEIALGHTRQRRVVLSSLRNLPTTRVATDNEVLGMIDANRLFGTGLGYVDAHLIAAARLTPGSSIWTRDKILGAIAARLGLASSSQALSAP